MGWRTSSTFDCSYVAHPNSWTFIHSMFFNMPLYHQIHHFQPSLGITKDHRWTCHHPHQQVPCECLHLPRPPLWEGSAAACHKVSIPTATEPSSSVVWSWQLPWIFDSSCDGFITAMHKHFITTTNSTQYPTAAEVLKQYSITHGPRVYVCVIQHNYQLTNGVLYYKYECK